MNTVDVGKVHILPPDASAGMVPESVPYVNDGVTGYHREAACRGKLMRHQLPDIDWPNPMGSGVWCTRFKHDDTEVHCCTLRATLDGGRIIAHMIWGGE